MTDETMRAEFERWYEADSMPSEADWFRREADNPNEYFHGATHWSWKAWQAAIATERARCAEIARSMGENEGPDYRRACDDIAGAIEDE